MSVPPENGQHNGPSPADYAFTYKLEGIKLVPMEKELAGLVVHVKARQRARANSDPWEWKRDFQHVLDNALEAGTEGTDKCVCIGLRVLDTNKDIADEGDQTTGKNKNADGKHKKTAGKARAAVNTTVKDLITSNKCPIERADNEYVTQPVVANTESKKWIYWVLTVRREPGGATWLGHSQVVGLDSVYLFDEFRNDGACTNDARRDGYLKSISDRFPERNKPSPAMNDLGIKAEQKRAAQGARNGLIAATGLLGILGDPEATQDVKRDAITTATQALTSSTTSGIASEYPNLTRIFRLTFDGSPIPFGHVADPADDTDEIGDCLREIKQFNPNTFDEDATRSNSQDDGHEHPAQGRRAVCHAIDYFFEHGTASIELDNLPYFMSELADRLAGTEGGEEAIQEAIASILERHRRIYRGMPRSYHKAPVSADEGARKLDIGVAAIQGICDNAVSAARYIESMDTGEELGSLWSRLGRTDDSEQRDRIAKSIERKCMAEGARASRPESDTLRSALALLVDVQRTHRPASPQTAVRNA